MALLSFCGLSSCSLSTAIFSSNVIFLALPAILVLFSCPTVDHTPSTEPSHERALSNLAYFDRTKAEKPDEFIDQEVPQYKNDRLDMSESDVYEATCREGRPYVSGWG